MELFKNAQLIQKKTENEREYKIRSKIIDLNPSISIITLHVPGLNRSIKRQKFLNG